MVFGFSKVFVIILFIALIIGWGSHNWINGIVIISIYVIIAIVWKLLT